MDATEAQRLVASWSELNLFLSRCRDSEVLPPLLRFALESRARWQVVERISQRYQLLRRREESELLKLGILPPTIKALLHDSPGANNS